ncbi:hypothetical protein IE53DRAFT_45280 [Violaceomyces palustris]|uniref:Uncharacterized protein n=1 Tax=Violaceomyces palustris TaxID=1673888 RepID=A0ACD0P0G0_9BASI|nr:hypothetical protein IE53DRAFT_45280 [Violaceomyces palustris]
MSRLFRWGRGSLTEPQSFAQSKTGKISAFFLLFFDFLSRLCPSFPYIPLPRPRDRCQKLVQNSKKKDQKKQERKKKVLFPRSRWSPRDFRVGDEERIEEKERPPRFCRSRGTTQRSMMKNGRGKRGRGHVKGRKQEEERLGGTYLTKSVVRV